MAFGWGSLLGGIAGGLFGMQGAQSAADTQAAAALKAAEMAKFDPYNVSGLFGSGTFDGKTASINLSPFAQSLTGMFGQQAQDYFSGTSPEAMAASQAGLGMLQSLGSGDPYAMAQSQFQKMEDILNPGRQRQREALQAQLLRQGRLGSTGGSLREQGLEAAIEESRQRGLFEALGQAQAVQQQQASLGSQLSNFGFNQGLSRLGAMQQLEKQAMDYLNMGGAFGGKAASSGAYGGNMLMKGAQGSAMANLGGTMGLAGMFPKIGAAFDTWNTPSPTVNAGGMLGSSAASGMTLPGLGMNPYAYNP